MTGKNLLYVAAAAFPFFMLLVVATIILILLPEIATFLPEQMR
jgi:TRAP-type C4-dicarboxylate transport system permease large subunit